MKLRTWLAGSVTLLVAVQGFAAIKNYTADGDQSTKFPSDRRIYRGDCDPGAATPNAGDNPSDTRLKQDQCVCTPGTNCAVGSVPAPKLCNAGSRINLNCVVDGDCPGGGAGSCALQTTAPENCSGSAGRPNGGACDPAIAYPAAGSCAPTFPTHASPEPGCNLSNGGGIVINDSGNGTPTLVSMVLVAVFDDFVGAATVTGIPGATVQLHNTVTLGPTPNQTGVGNTTGTINWGSLTGWSQTGQLFCQTNCPGGCNGASGCKPFVGFDGLGPPAPLKATAFVTDPWTFTGSGDAFTATSFEIASLGLGAVTAAVQIGGRLVSIPALPLAALGGLGAGLVYLGARALGRKRD